MLAKIWNSAFWVRLDEVVIENLDALLDSAGFGVLGKQRHDFVPQGVTCLWLLSESHLALHTWPEHGVAYVELSSCNKEWAEVFADGLERVMVIKQRRDGENGYEG